MKEECDQLKNKPLDQTSQEIKELKESLFNLQQDPVPSGVRGRNVKLIMVSNTVLSEFTPFATFPPNVSFGGTSCL